LRKLKLQDEEQILLQSLIEPKDIVSKLLEIQAEQQEKTLNQTSIGTATSKFVKSFCTFADNISHIVAVMLPQSSDYTVTFGMLFILFKVGIIP
jgi:hypothetical protein